MVTIEISPYGLHHCARLVAQLKGVKPGSAVRFDLSRWTFVRPPLLTIVAAHIRNVALQRQAGAVEVVLPVAPNVRNYLNQMNFEGALVRGEMKNLFEISATQNLPICPLRTGDDTESAALRLKQIVAAKLTSAPEVGQPIASALAITLAELMENFRKHSESASHAFACAQYYAEHEYQDAGFQHRHRQGAIEIAIADTGIGIEASLMSAPELAAAIRSGANPCELATRFGVTSKEGQGHQGYGLWITRRLAEKNFGSFYLMSGKHLFGVVRGRRPKIARLSVPWSGTFVGMRLNLHRPIDIQAVYGELPGLEILE